MTKSRAEYQRARRAARQAARPEHICEACGQTFQPKRSDARFCTDACRAQRWRPITHHALHHHPGGFPLKRNESGYPGVHACFVVIGEDETGVTFCPEPGAWRHDTVGNELRSVVFSAYYCDEHVGAHVPDGVVVGEPIHRVMDRDGRQARRQHGRQAPAS